jgi:hypothetical protein
MKLKQISIALGLVFALVGTAWGETQQPSRAHFHYQLFCQGCHGPGGEGDRAVPAFTDFVGKFLGSDEGREFLIRVPGSANAPLSDEELAEVLNWIVGQFAGSSEPAEWERFTEEEVTASRKKPLIQIIEYRATLLEALSTN